MACLAGDRLARPRPPPRNGAAIAGTCVPSPPAVPQPPTRSTDLSPNVRKRPGISTCAHRSEPPSASRDHEYKRYGTVSLLAGIDLLTGQVHALVKDPPRKPGPGSPINLLVVSNSCSRPS